MYVSAWYSPDLAASAGRCCALCGTGSFDGWLAAFKTEAVGKGISQKTVDAALTGVTLDNSVLSRDRGQQVFKQSFEEFSGRMVPLLLRRGSDMLKVPWLGARAH